MIEVTKESQLGQEPFNCLTECALSQAKILYMCRENNDITQDSFAMVKQWSVNS